MIDCTAIRKRLLEARNEVHALTSGRRNGGRDFQVSIPSRDSDSDFILHAALDDIEPMLKVLQDGPAAIAASAPEPGNSFNSLALRLSRLRVAPGDLVILTTPGALSEAALLNIRETVMKALPGVRVLVFEEGVNVGAVFHQEDAITSIDVCNGRVTRISQCPREECRAQSPRKA